jgi:lipid II:glycine glycyltransferase (peptidoglycan interpeptide bridge formation enzyme)
MDLKNYELIEVINENELREWDSLNFNSFYGHHLQLSNWLKSYRSYGFDFEILKLIDKKTGQIVAGAGFVIIKKLWIKLAICPSGPIIFSNDFFGISELIILIKNHYNNLNFSLVQFNLPIFADPSETLKYFQPKAISEKSLNFLIKGQIFKGVSAINGVRAVDLFNHRENRHFSEDELMKNFSKNTKRNIIKAYQFSTKVEFIKFSKDLKSAYEIIWANSISQGYTIRTWKEFGPYLTDMFETGHCHFIIAKSNDEVHGALILFECGQRLTYIMGGTKRLATDLKIGHLLHFEAIKYALKSKFLFYDISVGGPPSVTKFKEGFNGIHYSYLGNNYIVLNKLNIIIIKKISNLLKKKNSKLFQFILKLQRK